VWGDIFLSDYLMLEFEMNDRKLQMGDIKYDCGT
jgi:hypothetical protein